MDQGSPARTPFETVCTRNVRTGAKLLDLALCKNHRGHYVTVTEIFGERSKRVLIPAEALREVIGHLQSLAVVAGK